MNSLILRILIWIEDNLHENISTQELSIISGYSPKHLYTLFMKELGISAAVYIKRRRLSLSSIMLYYTNRPITDIALMYGFEPLSTFSRSFKKYFGVSPLEFRLMKCCDMSYFYPSAAIKDYDSNVFFVKTEDINITCDFKDTLPVNFGFNYLSSVHMGRIKLSSFIYNYYHKLIFTKYAADSFFVISNIVPGIKSDSEITICTGQTITSTDSGVDKTIIPGGYYACFVFQGTSDEIMNHHVWVKGAGLKKYSLVQKKEPSFTRISHTDIPGVFNSEYFVSCLPAYLRQTL
ncbi:helix-turn-helix transcriptional regulator [Salmonella enterica]|nr:helix-turn-helix transcriptional regulator [Salmonella enterica subsp. enterica serovar Oslo]EHW8352249.1 helix-turn-helix transcriptional regulator [Salmonella enterica]EHW8353117.1 helix-turn-helix transcriptional regulator [Salmonella enterica]